MQLSYRQALHTAVLDDTADADRDLRDRLSLPLPMPKEHAARAGSSRHDEAIHQPVALVPSLLEDRDTIVRRAENAISEVFRSHPCHLRPPPSEEMVTPWPAVARDDVPDPVCEA